MNHEAGVKMSFEPSVLVCYPTNDKIRGDNGGLFRITIVSMVINTRSHDTNTQKLTSDCGKKMNWNFTFSPETAVFITDSFMNYYD